MENEQETIQEQASVESPPDQTPPKNPNRPGRGGRERTAEERAVFNAEVARHRIDGMTFDNIAKKLQCAKATAWAGYKSFMVDYYKHHAAPAKVLLSEYVARKERIYRTLLAAYAESIPEGKHVGDTKFLHQAGQMLDDSFDREQSAGLIEKIKEQHVINGALDYKIEIVRPKDAKKEEPPKPPAQ